MTIQTQLRKLRVEETYQIGERVTGFEKNMLVFNNNPNRFKIIGTRGEPPWEIKIEIYDFRKAKPNETPIPINVRYINFGNRGFRRYDEFIQQHGGGCWNS